MLRVVVERAGEILHDGVFRKSLVSLGRDAENDVVLEDPYVSSQHVLVKHDFEVNAFRIFDQSSNGTFWEGERISTLKFDAATVLKISGFQVTLIPIKSTGTEERPDPGQRVDLFASTVLEKPFDGLNEEADLLTAPHPSLRADMLGLPDAELRSIAASGELKSLVFRGNALVGRSPECDLQFTSREISRRHCVIFAGPEGYTIRRLSKKNPVLVNQREIELGDTLILRDGDVISMCDEEIVFLCPATQPLSTGKQTIPLEASPNVDLVVTSRSCASANVAAFDVVGFLGGKTWTKFEDQLLGELPRSRSILIDLGYLVGVDREGIASLGRVIRTAEQMGVRIQLIRVTPRIADLLSYSQLKKMLTDYISKSEETAIRKLTA